MVGCSLLNARRENTGTEHLLDGSGGSLSGTQSTTGAHGRHSVASLKWSAWASLQRNWTLSRFFHDSCYGLPLSCGALRLRRQFHGCLPSQTWPLEAGIPRVGLASYVLAFAAFAELKLEKLKLIECKAPTLRRQCTDIGNFPCAVPTKQTFPSRPRHGRSAAIGITRVCSSEISRLLRSRIRRQLR